MLVFLTVARFLHFAGAISLLGVFAFPCLVARPGSDQRQDRQLRLVAWASLVLAVLSGGGWLMAVASQMSGRLFLDTLSQGVVGTVLLRTRFGQDWLLRVALAVLVAVCLLAHQRWRRAARATEWGGLFLAAALLASLAWAGHGAATPGAPGRVHLSGDVVHLLAAGLWLGTMPPLALLLAAARRAGTAGAVSLAGAAARRYSALAIGSVAALLAGGLVNTWFLAGTLPALIGTGYGRLVLLKIALFGAMLGIAAVNLLRLGPRLEGGEGDAATPRTIAQLRRNALIETGFGLGAVAIAALLGTMPPGLHAEPSWPLPFRLDLAKLSLAMQILAAATLALAAAGVIAATAAAAAGRYRPIAALSGAVALCLTGGWLTLAPAVQPATPASFSAPGRPYNIASVIAGGTIYAENCAACHGAGGHGDGPAAAGLAVRPVDLVAPHLFAHPPGDLFWWVSRGFPNGAMPGFAEVLTPAQRWDVVNFIRARAAAMLSRELGPTVGNAAYPVPDFAFTAGGAQHTLQEMLHAGPALLVLAASADAGPRLKQLTEAQPRLAKAGLRLVAVPVATDAENGAAPLVAVSAEVARMLALFTAPRDGGDTELLLDPAGNVRARWPSAQNAGLADAETLAKAAASLARLPAAPPTHAGHGG